MENKFAKAFTWVAAATTTAAATAAAAAAHDHSRRPMVSALSAGVETQKISNVK